MLHPRLKEDCYILGRLSLCHVLLVKDANYPWVILVPDRVDITEIFQLPEQDQMQLLKESSTLARILSEVFSADKINVATIGNLVPQLHVHHIARFHNDPAWPAPVWGYAKAKPYDDEVALRRITTLLKDALADELVVEAQRFT